MKYTWIIVPLVLLALVAPVCRAAVSAGDSDEPTPKYRCEEELGVCLNWMAKHFSERGWAGVQLDTEGFLYTVREVYPGSPAVTSDIRPGDVLVAINGIEFAEENADKLGALQDKMKPGAQFTYTIKRDGRRRNVEFKLVAMPFEVVAHQVGMHLMTDHIDIEKAFPAAD